MKLLYTLCLGLLLLGCNNPDARIEKVSKYEGTSNVRATAGGYLMYDIENGRVTCREHHSRAELACWSKYNGY